MKILKKLLIVLLLLGFLAILFVGIPYDTKYFDRQTLGTRIDTKNGHKTELERRKKQVYSLFLLSPEGPFYKGTIVSTYKYYLIKQNGTEVALSHIDKTGTSYAYLYDILPVQGSEAWVAFWLVGDEVNYSHVGLKLVVFDEKRILHNNRVKESIRTCTCRWDYSDSYSIYPLEGNNEIKFRTRDGDIIYEVLSNTFKKIN